MNITYVISQVFIVITYILLAISYRMKNRNSILICSFVSLIMAAISYLLLKAYMGLAMEIIAIIRNLIFIYEETNNNNLHINDLFVLISLFTISIICAVCNYNGFLSLMSLFSSLLYTYSVWQKDTELYKVLGIPVSIFGIIYFLYVKSYFGFTLELLLMLFNMVGLIKHKKSRFIS